MTNDCSTNQRMSIQEIGQRIKRAIVLHKYEVIGTLPDKELFQMAFDGHPLYEVVMSAYENDYEALIKTAEKMADRTSKVT